MLFITIILLNTVVSSANFSTLVVILLSKSLIYIKNNNGPNNNYCGTPLKTDFQFETSPSATTRFCQSAIVLSSRLCHPRYHGLFILVVIFDVAVCQKLSENLSIYYLLVIPHLSTQ